MMLNGKLTNEAARVGPLEPIYPLLAGDKPDWPRPSAWPTAKS